jgi:hypothetical protein
MQKLRVCLHVRELDGMVDGTLTACREYHGRARLVDSVHA